MIFVGICACRPAGSDNKNLNKLNTSTDKKSFYPKEVNHDEVISGKSNIAFVNVRLIDGISDSALGNVTVIVKSGLITGVGKTGEIPLPHDAKIIEGKGLTLMPGLIDAHFHYDYVKGFPALFLRNGVTSVRDPGQWIEAYDAERQSGKPLPRLFLTGPHIDSPPPSWPNDSYLVRDEAEVEQAMDYLIGQGVSAIKVYHRLSLGLIRKVCDIAHQHGLPVTAHLEITDARQAVLAGLDGIEHVTSVGTALVSRKRAEQFRQKILIDNQARQKERHLLWAEINPHGPEADSLIKFLRKHQTFFTPTLSPYEYRLESDKTDTLKRLGFENMMAFIGRCQKANVRLVLGSHGPWVPYAEKGWSYQYEMQLLAQAGMPPMKIIKAATIESARFLKIDHRLGTIEPGKQADLVLVEGDPSVEIKDMYNIIGVILNGVWIKNELSE